jgi:radical SAM superfamily enzyme YgiQ (UPF0313 family)
MGKIIRVFPVKTHATPTDDLVVINRPPGFFDQCDEVHISVAFTWELKRAEQLQKLWSPVAPVKIGGPATGERSGDFHPGQYLKQGCVITSRGCPNRCWFCSVWKREGDKVRELPIQDGYNIFDDNLLASSHKHIEAVFTMLRRQKEPIEFTGGLEAKRLTDWHINLLLSLKRIGQLFFAYDTEDDFEPLISAGKKLRDSGISISKNGNFNHRARCYCLVGFPKDTMANAENRMRSVYKLGFLPMAMLYRPEKGVYDLSWRRFQRLWARPAIISSMCKPSL